MDAISTPLAAQRTGEGLREGREGVGAADVERKRDGGAVTTTIFCSVVCSLMVRANRPLCVRR
jgi:hypothetical protein